MGAYSPAFGEDTGTWGLGVGLGDNMRSTGMMHML